MKLENLYNNIQSKLSSTMTEENFSRRDALSKAGSFGVKAAIAALPFALASLVTKSAKASTSATVVEVLNFALTLEYLERKFYDMGLNTNLTLIPSGDRAVFNQIYNHEAAHVNTLIATIASLGGTPVSQPTFDFTAGGAFPDVFTNYSTFLTLSQAFEDTGVRAYKGQAGNLMSNDAVLTAALQIHSVEARHASEVRRIRGQKGWIPNADGGGAPASIYVREDNYSQGGVDVRTITTVSAQSITEAFDETLTMAEVLAIADPFIV